MSATSATPVGNPLISRARLLEVPLTRSAQLLRDEAVNEKISQVYKYTAAAFAASCGTAIVFAATRLPLAMFATPTMAVGSIIGLTVIAVALLFGTMKTAKENTSQKHLLYGLFTVCEGIVLSPLVMINPIAFAGAALSTVALTGGLGVAAMQIKESFERYERILMVALGAIGLCSLIPVFAGGVVGALAHQISLVGGMALFSAFVIYDTHKARTEALKNPENFDPVNHSIGVYLDAVNFLIRFWEIYDKRRNG